MDDTLKLMIAMKSVIKMFESALQTVGQAALDDFDLQMNQMNAEQRLEFIHRKMGNPYSTLKPFMEKLEGDYEAFKANPEEIERTKKVVAEMLGIDVEELLNGPKQITEGNDSDNEDDDDTTKH